ncbi:TniB family NTP-binding protein [Xanthomonas campestris pv. raphani]|uniref:TniB family NTP-binding protein n=1 Tax=Xanthomonas campestris TaxID=339 RepID=UPI002B23EBEE|nr:TniB family NTP-binding protein [Xanthomonas campestris]MEA9787035.1 TniB family NTP-binding protein [Xanthomonas campestris pv. raphani]
MTNVNSADSAGSAGYLEGDLPFVLSSPSVRILKILSRLRTQEYKRSRPACLHIAAGAGFGKSRLLKHYVSQLYAVRDTGGSKYREAVLIEAPYDGNCTKMCRSIISACLPGYPVRRNQDIHEQVANVLRASGVKQLLIDEAGHILNAGRAGQQHTLALIKSICNLGITICIATTKNMVNVLAADEQLASRFKKIELPLWSESMQFRQFLAGIEAQLHLPSPSHLDSKTIIRWLTTHDCCVTFRLLEVLTGAARLAHSRGQPRITIELLDECWKAGLGEGEGHAN